MKNVYVAEGDKDAIIKKMGPDADKVSIVKDGDFISIGNGENLEVVAVPGHTAGPLFLFYGIYRRRCGFRRPMDADRHVFDSDLHQVFAALYR